jgi:hypothetical protein
MTPGDRANQQPTAIAQWETGPAPSLPGRHFLIGQAPRLLEYVQEHRPRQLAGLRVLVRGMVGRQQYASVRHNIFSTMPELVLAFARDLFFAEQVVEISFEPDSSQSNNHLQFLQSFEFPFEIRSAVG